MKKGERKVKSDRKRKKKDFDCVEMKRRAQAKIYKETKDMTLKEELAYWNRPAEGPLADWWRSIQSGSRAAHTKPATGSGGKRRA